MNSRELGMICKGERGVKKSDYIENFIFDASLSSRLIPYSV